MTRSGIRLAALLCGISFAMTRTASATPINYGDFLGSAPGEVDFLQVTEDSSTDATPLYDAPIHLTNKLVFTPLGFAAGSSNGTADTTNGTLILNIRADVGGALDYIVIHELGDYTLSGVGTSATGANIVANMSALDLSPGTHGAFNDGLNFTPSPLYTLPAGTFDEFAGLGVINLTGLGISEIFLTLTNNLTATSEMGTTSFIQKKNIIIEATDQFIPEPATMSLLLTGGLLMLRRRR